MNEESKPKRIQVIGPVQINTDNPWRTQGDYREEQRQMRSAYRWAIGASLAAIIAALCSMVLAYSAFVEIAEMSKGITASSTEQQSTK